MFEKSENKQKRSEIAHYLFSVASLCSVFVVACSIHSQDLSLWDK